MPPPPSLGLQQFGEIRVRVWFHYVGGWQELGPIETTRRRGFTAHIPCNPRTQRNHTVTLHTLSSTWKYFLHPEDGSSMNLRNVSPYCATLSEHTTPASGHQTRLIIGGSDNLTLRPPHLTLPSASARTHARSHTHAKL